MLTNHQLNGVQKAVRPRFRRRYALFFLSGLLWPSDAFAVRRFEDLTGVSQAFTRGYDYRAYSEASSDEGSYELLVPDAKKKEAIEKALEEEERQLDTWRYRRSIQASSTYVSNLNHTRNDPKDDVIHNLAPTVGMSRRTEHTYVDLFYKASYTTYVETEKLNALTHQQGTTVGYRFGRLRLNFTNVLSPSTAYDTAERTELENTATTGAGRTRIQAINDVFTASADLKVSDKTSTSFTYARDYFLLPVRNNSLTANGFSTVSHRLTPRVSYRLTPKTSVFGEYTFNRADFFEGGLFGSDEHSGRLGMAGRINDRTYVTFATGLRLRDYKDENLDPEDGLTWTASISRKLTEKLAVSVSTTKGQSENFDTALRDTLQENTFFTGVDFTFKLSAKTSLALGGSMGFVSSDGLITQIDPDNPTLTFTREPGTQLYDWYVSWAWSPRRWISTLLAYQYKNQNGSFKGDEYQEHRMVGSLNASF